MNPSCMVYIYAEILKSGASPETPPTQLDHTLRSRVILILIEQYYRLLLLLLLIFNNIFEYYYL